MLIVVLCILLLTPFLAPLCLLLGFWLYAESSHVVESGKVRWQMARRGRVVKPGSLTENLTHGDGTLIVERISAGFPWSRLWWTEDNVSALAPMTPLTGEILNDDTSVESKQRAYQFETWVDETYLDLENGKAQLVRAHRGYQTLKALQQRFPEMRSLRVAPLLLRIELEIDEDDDILTTK